MSILNLLRADGSIVVNKSIARRIGLNEAIILSELISLFLYHQGREELTEDNYFYATMEKIEENTTLRRSAQDKALETLYSLGLVTKDMRGLPAKRHFTIHEDKIAELILASKHVEKRQPDNDAEPEPKKADKPRGSQLVGKRQPRTLETDNQERRKTTTSNTNLYNTNLEEEEDYIKAIRHRYSKYDRVVKSMIEKQGTGSISFKDTEFLDQCLFYEMDAITVFKIYNRIKEQLGVFHVSAISKTFEKFIPALRAGEIDIVDGWFASTFTNEHMKCHQGGKDGSQ